MQSKRKPLLSRLTSALDNFDQRVEEEKRREKEAEERAKQFPDGGCCQPPKFGSPPKRGKCN